MHLTKVGKSNGISQVIDLEIHITRMFDMGSSVLVYSLFVKWFPWNRFPTNQTNWKQLKETGARAPL